MWRAIPPPYLTFPGGVYDVDFARRTIRALFTPAEGETVLWATPWRDLREKATLAIVKTDRSVHILTEAGEPVVSVPLARDAGGQRLRSVGRLQDPERFVFRYGPTQFVPPEEYGRLSGFFLEYDAAGREIVRQILPTLPTVEPSPAETVFGLATPPTEAVALIGTSWGLRREARATGGREEWVLLDVLEQWLTFIPLAVWRADTSSGLFWGFTALALLAATACAVGSLLLARRYAFSRTGCVGWALCGFLFGWFGLVLMLTLLDWPARVRCPSCSRLRRVDRDHCEHCRSPHAQPAQDGTEVFEESPAAPPAALAVR
jgi:hypothetical protein